VTGAGLYGAYRMGVLDKETFRWLFDTVHIAAVEIASLFRDPTKLKGWLAVLLSLQSGSDSGIETIEGPALGEAVAEVDDERQARRLVHGAWKVVVDASGIERPDRHTPAEVVEAAVQSGLPAGATRQVAEAFRSTEYGGTKPIERASQARRGLELLREDAEVDEDG
ncbi:MAG: DUF4129 domain-containing protein, partial [Halobacteriota archaeon]